MNLLENYNNIINEKREGIPINIWDDYYDDGHAPKGKRQETYMYIEDGGDRSKEQTHKILIFLHDIIKNFDFLHDVSVSINNKEKLFTIYFIDLTHIKRKQLLKELISLNLKFNNETFNFYSGS